MKDMRQNFIDHQFMLPQTSSMTYLAYRYPTVPWKVALEFYSLAVHEVLIMYHAENLFDPPLDWGRGLVYARNLFEQKLQNYIKNQK